MNPNEFLRQLDDARIVEAIAAAERRTSGEIRVYVSHLYREDALTAARARFQKIGMQKTRERNGVLIYFVPRTRSFAIIGDAGIDAKCGESFWTETAAALRSDLHDRPATEAIVLAIERIGKLLARTFPIRADDRNELPDAVERDPD
jgi:uncharacterized membrane protein